MLTLLFCFFSLPYGTKHFREEDTERHITPSVRCEIIWKIMLAIFDQEQLKATNKQ